jgi:hypothetical protein
MILSHKKAQNDSLPQNAENDFLLLRLLCFFVATIFFEAK